MSLMELNMSTRITSTDRVNSQHHGPSEMCLPLQNCYGNRPVMIDWLGVFFFDKFITVNDFLCQLFQRWFLIHSFIRYHNNDEHGFHFPFPRRGSRFSPANKLWARCPLRNGDSLFPHPIPTFAFWYHASSVNQWHRTPIRAIRESSGISINVHKRLAFTETTGRGMILSVHCHCLTVGTFHPFATDLFCQFIAILHEWFHQQF